MDPEQRQRFPPTNTVLRDGRQIELSMIEPTDGPALADFYDSLPRETWRFYCPPRLTHADAKKKASLALSPTHVVLLAEDPQTAEIVGYNWYKWVDETSRTSVFGICVRESHRGAGLAQALMTRLLGIAREVGPPTMSLTVQLANARAIHLYTKMGFQIVRRQTRAAVEDFSAEPEYCMEQAL